MPREPKSGGMSKSGRKPIRLIQTGTDILRNVRSARNSESIAMKPGLNRRENRLRSRGASQRLEPDEGKLSRPVLRGGGGSNAVSLPDLATFPFWQSGWCERSEASASRPTADMNSNRH